MSSKQPRRYQPWRPAAIRAILGILAVFLQKTGWSGASLAIAALISTAASLAPQAAAEPIRPVVWVDGSASAISSGVSGQIDIASPEKLAFRTDTGTEFTILYTAIQQLHYKYEVRHHLGVLPAIAVGLIAARQHRHLVTISYTDPATQAKQAVIFDLPKDGATLLLTVLRTRTTACTSQTSGTCAVASSGGGPEPGNNKARD